MTTEEGWHTVQDGTKLYTKVWKPAGEVRAKAVFVHGYSDHCNAYYDFFPTLASRGIEVVGYDQRGWGHTVTKPADRGNTGPTSLVMADLESIINSQLPSKVPFFLIGHSMGGAEVLWYACTAPASTLRQIRGFLCESPFLDFPPGAPDAPSKLHVAAGRLAGRVLPRRQLHNQLDATTMSRDVRVQQDYVHDMLCHNTGTLEGLTGMFDRCAGLKSGRMKLKAEVRSLWVGHGTGDLCTSCPASEKWAKEISLKDKTFKPYEGWFHKLHAEPNGDAAIFANDVADWILARSDATDLTTSPQPPLPASIAAPGEAKQDEEDDPSKARL